MRKVKDAVDLGSGEKIYFRGHAQATYMSDGRTVEEAVNQGGGGKPTVSFLDNESLIGLPFGYTGGYYKSYKLDGVSVDEVDLGYLDNYYYGNLAVAFADNLFEFKVEDLYGEGQIIGSANIRLTNETHLIIKPFFPQNTTIGWRIFTSRMQVPAEWIDDTDIQNKLTELSTEIEQVSENKQDKISDLDSIRSGASKGKTSEQTSNKTTTISESSTDTQYPSAKAVYNAIQSAVTNELNSDF